MKRERQHYCTNSTPKKVPKLRVASQFKMEHKRQAPNSISADANKRRKVNITQLFDSLKINPALQHEKDYTNAFETHSKKFRHFIIDLHGFLTNATKDVMDEIQKNWMKLIEPVRTHLDPKTILLLDDKIKIQKWHSDVSLAAAAAAALKEEASKWEIELRETNLQLEFIIATLK